MSGDDTSIRIHRDTWRRLHDLKEPGKSFDEVINEVLDDTEIDTEAGKAHQE